MRVQLLVDIRSIFGARDVERISSMDLVATLNSLEGHPWPDWANGKGMTTNQLARQLAPFEIRPKNMRIGKEPPSKGYLPPLGPSDKP
jgi:hypothetical protein